MTIWAPSGSSVAFFCSEFTQPTNATQPSLAGNNIMISFVIPAHNEERLLPRTLRAVHEAARSVGFTHAGEALATTDARYESIDRRQIAAARNAGARAAAGDTFIFVDADTQISPAALRAALDALRRGARAGGAEVRFDGRVPRYALIVLPAILFLFRLARMAGGCFIFCTREACEAIGGWDESVFASEELLFAKAIKRRYGRRAFTVLREQVITSGRKLRTYTPRELFGPLLGVALRGKRGLATRDRLGVWYDPRRPDPEVTSATRG